MDASVAEANSPECFVISPIGAAKSETRKRADQVFRHIITPVVSAEGLTPLRADKLGKPGVITSQVIDHVVNAELVVADLSEHNANVFYELAIRHAFRRPLIQLISVEWELPFDLLGMRTVFFDLKDPDSIEEAKAELAAHLAAVRDDQDAADTPISLALDLKEMRSSGDLVARSLADIQTAIAELRADLLRGMRSGPIWTSLPTHADLARENIYIDPSILRLAGPATPQRWVTRVEDYDEGALEEPQDHEQGD